MFPVSRPIVIPSEVRLHHFPMAFNKTKQTPTNPLQSSPLAGCSAASQALAQSDFSFSFMCKKTTLKRKSPAIMEKALA